MATRTRDGVTVPVRALEYRTRQDGTVALAYRVDPGAQIGDVLPGDDYRAKGLQGTITVGDDGVARLTA